jgi:arsenate reductase-like glutaredoxin family protein
MGLKAGLLSDDRLLELMVDNPQLIRRPIILKDGKIQLGFGAKQGLTV